MVTSEITQIQRLDGFSDYVLAQLDQDGIGCVLDKLCHPHASSHRNGSVVLMYFCIDVIVERDSKLGGIFSCLALSFMEKMKRNSAKGDGVFFLVFLHMFDHFLK